MEDAIFVANVGMYTICETAAIDRYGATTTKLKAIQVRTYDANGSFRLNKIYKFLVEKEGAKDRAIKRGKDYAEKYKGYPRYYRRKLNKQP